MYNSVFSYTTEMCSYVQKHIYKQKRIEGATSAISIKNRSNWSLSAPSMTWARLMSRPQSVQDVWIQEEVMMAVNVR